MAWSRRSEPAAAAGSRVFATAVAPEDGATGTASVEAHAHAASPDGFVDLLGNVWEWTEASAADQAPEEGYAWVMGGSFRHPCRTEDGPPRTRVAVSKAYAYLGFRCAADGPVGEERY